MKGGKLVENNVGDDLEILFQETFTDSELSLFNNLQKRYLETKKQSAKEDFLNRLKNEEQ